MKNLVITGLGAVTPIGIGVHNYWQGILDMKCGIKKIAGSDGEELPITIAGEVEDFHATDHMSPKLAKETSTFIQYAYASAKEAIEQSGIHIDKESDRVGIVMATALNGTSEIAETEKAYSVGGKKRVSPRFLPKILGNLGAAQIAIAYGIHGPSFTVSTACSSGGDAICMAAMLLNSGEADVILVAAGESAHCPIILSTLASAKALSRNPDPVDACKPFDETRDGFVIGEGGGALILETEDHALKRGAHIICRLAGYSNNTDGYHVTAPRPDGSGAAVCMKAAMKKAGLEPEDIDYINAHGTSTPVGDLAEVTALKTVFDKVPPVSSTKGNTGHLMGAGGITEVIACIKAIETETMPPTLNCKNPDPQCDLDLITEGPRKATVKTAMSNALGFGGQNSSIILKEYVPE